MSVHSAWLSYTKYTSHAGFVSPSTGANASLIDFSPSHLCFTLLSINSVACRSADSCVSPSIIGTNTIRPLKLPCLNRSNVRCTTRCPLTHSSQVGDRRAISLRFPLRALNSCLSASRSMDAVPRSCVALPDSAAVPPESAGLLSSELPSTFNGSLPFNCAPHAAQSSQLYLPPSCHEKTSRHRFDIASNHSL